MAIKSRENVEKMVKYIDKFISDEFLVENADYNYYIDFTNDWKFIADNEDGRIIIPVTDFLTDVIEHIENVSETKGNFQMYYDVSKHQWATVSGDKVFYDDYLCFSMLEAVYDFVKNLYGDEEE